MKPPDEKYRNLRKLCVVAVWLLFCNVTVAQTTRDKIHNQMFDDTIGVSKSFKKNELQSHSFYDTMKNSKKWVVRTIASLLIGSRSSADDAFAIEENVLSKDYFENFDNKIITKINIVNANIFARTDLDDLSWAEKTLDKLHVKTRYQVIEKNLLFKVGQNVDPYKMSVNEQLLRSKPYISTAFFILINDKNHPGGVIVNVFTRDNWTISANVTFGGEPNVELFDRNFVGSGNMLKFSYYPKTSNQYDAFETQYVVNNLWGTFANATLQVGVGATNNSLMAEINRPFILPTDHIWGLKMGYTEHRNNLKTVDSTIKVNKEEIGLYYGFTVDLKKKSGTVAYFTIAPSFVSFKKRVNVDLYNNPYYTDRFDVLANIGVSQQNFFQGNMIYGYGKIEDIPYGYKFEISGGWQNNLTIGKRWYMGAYASWARYTKSGYYNVILGAQTYLTYNGKLQQSHLSAQAKYFSPLVHLNSIHLRQFVNVTYDHGFNRLYGEKELLNYEKNAGIRGVSSNYNTQGINRLTINAETVLFTPIFFYHFRFAFYGWIDTGWLGMNDVFYKNDFSSAIGVGVRIKNERLIFNNIQLRFGVSLSRPNGTNFNWFDINNESVLQIQPLTPQHAQIQEFN